jgi:hypothetical protein
MVSNRQLGAKPVLQQLDPGEFRFAELLLWRDPHYGE